MSFPRRHHFRRKERQPYSSDYSSERFDAPQEMHPPIDPENTGSESTYLKSLIDSQAKVTVVLTDGERLHGFIRYYDRYCFSIGLSTKGPKIFLRKASVAYISRRIRNAADFMVHGFQKIRDNP